MIRHGVLVERWVEIKRVVWEVKPGDLGRLSASSAELQHVPVRQIQKWRQGGQGWLGWEGRLRQV